MCGQRMAKSSHAADLGHGEPLRERMTGIEPV
jgi:hypothetical protein